ncbi:hypothetical protein LBMAG56_53700 [Verrucomicrobiota bacterium]|nr:hypothetical protein LBMAG56_53700 [Verrucomicrobiota bacterium]
MIDLLAELTTVAATSAFSTMADCALTAQPATALALNGERCITSSVRYSGPVSGVLHLHAPARFARQISATLLAHARADDVPDELVADTMGEFTNMVIAKLQSRLTDRGTPCVITPPDLAWHPHFTPHGTPGPRCRTLPFACKHGQLVIELLLT